MKADSEPKNAIRMAKTLSLVAFGFMSLVSLVVFYTEDQLSVLDYLFILGSPFVLGALGYFVGLHHDPTASE
jgi:hypothetical protein